MAFIRSLPPDEQSKWYNATELYAVLLAQWQNRLRRPCAPREAEQIEDYTKYLERLSAQHARRTANRAAYAQFSLRTEKNAWLTGLYGEVLHQALRKLEAAFASGTARQESLRATGRPVRSFRIGYKQSSSPSAFTFCVPASALRCRHVDRPTDGPAVCNKTEVGIRRKWTEIALPKVFGGGVVWATQQVALTADGHPLAAVTFSRDRLGRWHGHFQRPSRVTEKPSKLLDQRSVVFLDPGTRAGNNYYSPDTLEVGAYLEGQGGIARLMTICLNMDAIISEGKRVRATDPAVHQGCKRREHRLRTRISNLVHDAHVRAVADLVRRFDTIVVPKFDLHRTARRKRSPDDPSARSTTRLCGRCLPSSATASSGGCFDMHGIWPERSSCSRRRSTQP